MELPSCLHRKRRLNPFKKSSRESTAQSLQSFFFRFIELLVRLIEMLFRFMEMLFRFIFRNNTTFKLSFSFKFHTR